MKRAWGVMLMTVVACGGDADPRDDDGDGAPEERLDARVREQDAASDSGPRLDARAAVDAGEPDAREPST
ncbi:MAG: hypothetical protein ABW352_04255, partial [Polyangiales bacterium]